MLSYPPLSFGPSTKRDIPAGEFPAGFDAVGLEFLLQLLDPDPGHVELVLHLPDVGVAEGVSAAVAPQLVLGLEHSAPERQRFTHALSKGVGVRAGELGREGLGQGSCEGDPSGQAYSLVFSLLLWRDVGYKVVVVLWFLVWKIHSGRIILF